MRKTLITVIFVLFCAMGYAQNMAPVLKYIQHKSDIKEGGTEVFQYEGSSYVISVAYLSVNGKSEQQCKTVGNAKAKKEMLSYINGAEITSYTELKVIETVTESMSGSKVESSQQYNEVIKEKVVGTINQVTPLGGWYSEDRSVYYFAIYKPV